MSFNNMNYKGEKRSGLSGPSIRTYPLVKVGTVSYNHEGYMALALAQYKDLFKLVRGYPKGR
jgi:hypothetical protein